MCSLDHDFINRETLSVRNLFEFSTTLGSCQRFHLNASIVPEADCFLLIEIDCLPGGGSKQ